MADADIGEEIAGGIVAGLNPPKQDFATTGSEVESVTPNAGAATALQNAGMAAQGEQAAAQTAIPLAADATKAQAAGLDTVAQADQAAAARSDAAALAEHETLESARKLRDKDLAEAKATPFNDYFHNKDGSRNWWTTITSGIGLALGGLSANPVAAKGIVDSIDANVTGQFDRQRQAMAAKLDVAKQRGENVRDLEAQFEREMARSKLREGLAHQAIDEQMQAASLRAGIPAAQANALVAAYGGRQKAELAIAQANSAYHKSAKSESKETKYGPVPGGGKTVPAVRDPVTGAPLGTSGTPRTNDTQDAELRLRQQLDDHLAAYQADVVAHPGLLAPGSPEAIRRQSLQALVQTRLAGLSAMGVSNEALDTESKTLGPNGVPTLHGLSGTLASLQSPSPEVLAAARDANRNAMQMQVRQLQPLPREAAAAASRGLTPAQQAMLRGGFKPR